jgi:hypothetical protein
MAHTTYRVTKVKTDKQGKKHFQEIGKLVIRENGNGVLFLHMYDGEYVVVPKRKGEQDETSGEGVEGGEVQS